MKYDSDNQRVHRISSVIRKEIAKIIQNDINDQRIKDVIITDVEMSKDLKNARIFFVVFNIKAKRDEEIKLITKTINASKLFFKKQLSKNSNLRSVPNLRFIYDETESKAYELEQLINKNLYK
ncbi:MAG: 30S ribosome-binding factor RbfA [Pseudomonadota bacterium]|jgi:ribosome-binding factor A|nr:30S ribosome-binding factor RbfA [Pseudomonadota bacterium]